MKTLINEIELVEAHVAAFKDLMAESGTAPNDPMFATMSDAFHWHLEKMFEHLGEEMPDLEALAKKKRAEKAKSQNFETGQQVVYVPGHVDRSQPDFLNHADCEPGFVWADRGGQALPVRYWARPIGRENVRLRTLANSEMTNRADLIPHETVESNLVWQAIAVLSVEMHREYVELSQDGDLGGYDQNILNGLLQRAKYAVSRCEPGTIPESIPAEYRI